MTKPILSILFILGAIFSFVLYVQPTYDAIREKKDTAASYDIALEKTREIQELKRTLLSRYNLFSGDNLDRLHKMLPDHVDNVRLVLDMDSIASRYGIRLQNVEVEHVEANATSESQTILSSGTAGGDTAYRSLTLQFDVVSTYDNFLQFMQDLETSLRIVDVVSMTVKKDASGYAAAGAGGVSAGPTYKFGVELRTYWLK